MLFFKQYMKTRLTISSLTASLLTGAFFAMPPLVLAGPATKAAVSRPAATKSESRPTGADLALLTARDAFRAGDAAKLSRAAMSTGGHVLEPYVGYWQLRLKLDERRSDEILTYLERNAGSLLAEQLRRDWLKSLGRRSEWALFQAHAPLLVGDDPEVTCYGLIARYQTKDESSLIELKPLWQLPRDLPEACMPIAQALLQSGRWADAQVWERFRILADANLLVGAKRTLGFLARGEAPDPKQLDAALTASVKYLERPIPDMTQAKRSQRELYLLAVARLARTDPTLAASYWDTKTRTRFSLEDQAYVLGLIATNAARKLMPEATGWYTEVSRLGGDAQLTDEQLAWRVRIALRQENWGEVRTAVERMSLAGRNDPAWIYWLGRAYKAQGAIAGAPGTYGTPGTPVVQTAQALFARIAGEHHFYGQLAAEELGAKPPLPPAASAPSPAEMAAAGAEPGLQRALALYRLDMRTEATREWIWTVRAMDDRSLLAAAELARRNEIWDRAINTADRTVASHDFSVRYLAPYRDVLASAAKARSLEEPLVLGLVRQESRFISVAKSGVGASGLMQLMPATAAWVAKKMGMTDFSQSRVHEPEVNAKLGTYYLRQVLDELDGMPVVAAAAYNAGPGRARRWREVAGGKPIEGAIYAESIPFSETRDYVKKVMANTVYYAAVLGGEARSLKARLGMVAARPDADRQAAAKADPTP